MQFVSCCLATNMSPWKPIFRTLEIDHFQTWITSCIWTIHIVSKWPMSVSQMQWIKQLKHVYIFCFHGNGTNLPSDIVQNTAILKQIILLMQTEIWIIYTHSSKSTSDEQNQKIEIIKLFKYRLPWQPNHQIVSDFAKNELIQSKISPLNNWLDWLLSMYILCNQRLIFKT